jgi:F420-dependent oxidoreductase-like protein
MTSGPAPGGTCAHPAAVVEPAGLPLSEALERVRLAEELGYRSVWLTQLPDVRDAATVLAAYAGATRRMVLGTAVLPIHTRHPTAMAQMAMTLDELSGGRFRLGLGFSHQFTVEWIWGLKMKPPLEAMREYVGIVRAGIRDGTVDFQGRHFTARWTASMPRRTDLPLYLAGLRSGMVRLAGELADGLALWLCPPGYVRDRVLPSLRAGRPDGAGLDGFEVLVPVPLCLSTDPEADRAAFRRSLAFYARLPYYRRMLEAGGCAADLRGGGFSDHTLDQLGGVGGEREVRRILRSYRAAGCTLPAAWPQFTAHKDRAAFAATLQAALDEPPLGS